nr:MAG TPA: hypothetical protein [Caudoviricetes sp.]
MSLHLSFSLYFYHVVYMYSSDYIIILILHSIKSPACSR